MLAAVRESVVLYGAVFRTGWPPRTPRYAWRVDGEIARHANRFISTFNALFDEHLPPARAAQAETYWNACADNGIEGRCVRIADDPHCVPERHYHWGIWRSADDELHVQDFWKNEVWTTDRYDSVRQRRGQPPQV